MKSRQNKKKSLYILQFFLRAQFCVLKHFISFRPEFVNCLKLFKNEFSRPQNGWTVTPARSVSSLSSGISNRCGTARRSGWDRYLPLLSRPVNLLHSSLGPVESGTDIFLGNNQLSVSEHAALSHSTTVGSVGRRCAANVHPNVPPSPWWALNSRCACVTAATSPSLTKSE